MDIQSTLIDVGISASYVALAGVLVIVGKIINDVITPFNDNKVLTEDDNVAFGVCRSGYYLGIIIIFLGASIGPLPDEELATSLGSWLQEVFIGLGIAAAYAFAGILALNMSRFILDKVIMPKFSISKEIIEDKNAGAGAILFGTYIATAMTIAAAINGQVVPSENSAMPDWLTGILSAVVFYVLGQIALILFAKVYEFITPFKLHEMIEKDNVAAGIAFGGTLIAVGILVANATKGDFFGWMENLVNYGIILVVGFPLLLVVRLLTDLIILPKSSLSKEIAEDQNKAAAFIEASIAISVAVVIFVMI